MSGELPPTLADLKSEISRLEKALEDAKSDSASKKVIAALEDRLAKLEAALEAKEKPAPKKKEEEEPEEAEGDEEEDGFLE